MEIKIMQAIQSIYVEGTFLGSLLDSVMLGFTLFGEMILVLAVLFVSYWCVDKKFGEYLLFCVFCSSCISFSLKDIFKRARPIFSGAVESGEIRHLKVDNFLIDTDFKPTSFSFPSGHTTNGGTLYLSIATYFKKRWVTIVGIILTIMLGISRLYIGVHYPTDVLAGYIISFLVSVILGSLFLKYYKYKYYFIGGATLFFVIIALIFSLSGVKILGLLGAGIGYCICAPIEEKFVKFDSKSIWWKRALRLLVGLVSAGLVFLLCSLVLPLEGFGIIITMALVVGSAVLLAPYLFKVLKL